MKITKASGLIECALRRTGFAGVTLPWSIYILPERLRDLALIAHERVHEAQMARMGVVRFYAVYTWQVLRYGYRDAPLEREARGECPPDTAH